MNHRPEKMIEIAESYYERSIEYEESNGEYSASVVVANTNRALYWMLIAIYAKLNEKP